MKMFKDDRTDYIGKNLSIEITLENAIKEIKKFPTTERYRNGLLGFINNDVTIQLFRYETDDWLIDIPLLKATKPPYALQDEELSTKKVEEVITLFSKNQDWKSVINLKSP